MPADTMRLVISHLSVGEHAVNEDTFQSTMKYIFSFIEKVRYIIISVLVLRRLIIRRRNKRKTLLRSCANDSAWRTNRGNGETSRFACPCCHSSRNAR